MERRSRITKEDEALFKLVEEYGTGEWAFISRKLAEIYGICGRNGKQCRERWMNHIDPKVLKKHFEDEEEELLFAAIKKHGTKLAEIAKEMPGRSDNMIKNHFYSIIKKAFRKIKKVAKTGIPIKSDLTIKHLWEMLKINQLPISVLSNKSIIKEINLLKSQDSDLNPTCQSSMKESFPSS